jgi:1,4-alpha-glucan branching enzyme
MDIDLYDLMDWPEIEGIVYSECDNPHKLLGPHIVGRECLIQAYIPDAVSVYVKVSAKKKYEMQLADDAGYFAVLIPYKTIPSYTFEVEYENGTKGSFIDPYAFEPTVTEVELEQFSAGVNYNVYRMLGSHIMEINGVKGTAFAVWAPNAMRVSVVGDFNFWDGRTHQMRRLKDSGVFELFVPGLSEGGLYKYEIRFKGGLVGLKADPYANAAELRPGTASRIWDIDKYEWNDAEWMKKRGASQQKEQPMSVYELHLGSFQKPQEKEFYNYRELAPMVISYVKDMGYTHVELMPVTEYPFDASWGYQVTGYYAPTARYGTPEDFKFFMDELHKAGIGVILDWVPAHFPRDAYGLARFDGTCLYEHFDPRQGEHPDWGTFIYNYGRPQVKNFLIGSALFWAKEYHADGIRMDAVASMLYLDYGKKDGEWIPNIYGGKENLEAVEFMKHLNSIFKKTMPDVMLIAEESTAWPKVTGKVEEDSLGFDYKWNMGWMNDFLEFMQNDPLYRKGHYGELTFSMIYNYSEDFVLVFSHDEVVHGKASMLNKMPGGTVEEKAANLRAAYGFMFTHPGKKLLFMGQDFGQTQEWSEEKSVQWDLLQFDVHRQLQDYVRDLNALYRNEPALHVRDYDPQGFRWINCISADETIVVYERLADEQDRLIVVANFTPVARENYKIGVTGPGKYKEIFNSDSEKYGGSGFTNPRVKFSRYEECDGFEDSIRIKVPPMGITVLRYIPVVEEEKPKAAKAKKQKNKK